MIRLEKAAEHKEPNQIPLLPLFLLSIILLHLPHCPSPRSTIPSNPSVLSPSTYRSSCFHASPPLPLFPCPYPDCAGSPPSAPVFPASFSFPSSWSLLIVTLSTHPLHPLFIIHEEEGGRRMKIHLLQKQLTQKHCWLRLCRPQLLLSLLGFHFSTFCLPNRSG